MKNTNELTRRTFQTNAVCATTALAAITATGSRLTAADAKKKYRAAVIGHTGRGNYGHGMEKLWADVDAAELVAVADAQPDGLAKTSKRLGVKGFADYKQMLTHTKPDLVAVGPRWLDQHRDMVVACAEAGVKGIYLEKPMCQDLQQADEMIAACEKSGTKLAMATQNRYSPQVKIIAKMITDGDLGDLVEIRARGKDDRRGGGEDLWVLGTHMLDLMSLFGGGAKSCYAQVYNEGHLVTSADVYDGAEGIGPLAGDEVHAMYRLGIGINGYWDSKRGAEGKPSRFGIRIQGTKGVVELYDTGSLPLTLFLPASSWSTGRSDTQWQRINSGGMDVAETIPSGGLHAGNVLAVKDLIASIEADRQPIANIYEARKTVEMIAAVFESHRLQESVDLPLQNRANPLTMLK